MKLPNIAHLECCYQAATVVAGVHYGVAGLRSWKGLFQQERLELNSSTLLAEGGQSAHLTVTENNSLHSGSRERFIEPSGSGPSDQPSSLQVRNLDDHAEVTIKGAGDQWPGIVARHSVLNRTDCRKYRLEVAASVVIQTPRRGAREAVLG